MGSAFGLATNDLIIIGSHKLAKAEKRASQVCQAADGHGKVWGTNNAGAVRPCDVVVLSLPLSTWYL